MKNNNFYKLSVFIFSVLFFSFNYFSVEFEYLNLYNIYTDSMLFCSLSLLIVSPFLFFLRDEMFSKWIRLSVFWFGISTIFIMIAPVYWGGWMSFGPTKELVSIWSGILFVFTSLLFIIWKRRT